MERLRGAMPLCHPHLGIYHIAFTLNNDLSTLLHSQSNRSATVSVLSSERVRGAPQIRNLGVQAHTNPTLPFFKKQYRDTPFSDQGPRGTLALPFLNRALARISELGVQKYTFGVNWVSNSFSSHCIIVYTQNIWILGCPKPAPLAKGLFLNLSYHYHHKNYLSILLHSQPNTSVTVSVSLTIKKGGRGRDNLLLDQGVQSAPPNSDLWTKRFSCSSANWEASEITCWLKALVNIVFS